MYHMYRQADKMWRGTDGCRLHVFMIRQFYISQNVVDGQRRLSNRLFKHNIDVDFESDITSSTVTYPLPDIKGGQKGGQINDMLQSDNADMKDDSDISSGQKQVVRNGGQKQGDETRAKIIEAMRRKPEISRKELTEIIGISPSAIQKHIECLKSSKIIVRLGSDRKGLWKVLK